MRQRIIFVFAAAAAVAAVAAAATFAQAPNAPALNQGFAGDRTVSGRAAPGSGPIKVYDVSTTPRTEVGQGETSMDSTGNFAVSVDPPLVLGHRIVAVDKQGRSSAPMIVADTGPAAGPHP